METAAYSIPSYGDEKPVDFNGVLRQFADVLLRLLLVDGLLLLRSDNSAVVVVDAEGFWGQAHTP